MLKELFSIGKNKIFQYCISEGDSSLSPDEIRSNWADKFSYIEEELDTEGNITKKGLRIPQIGAIHAFMADNQKDGEAAIIVMPTGTGKTETMMSILIAKRCQKLLVLVPSDPLRNQISDKFKSLGILPEFGIVSNDIVRPKVGVVRSGMSSDEWSEFLSKTNVVITTMSIMNSADRESLCVIKESVSNVFIDEAHHIEAGNWSKLASYFSQDILTLFTATPFRNDGKKLRGKFIYNFSLKEAQRLNYYRKISLQPVRAYNQKDSDLQISQKAIAILREDLKKYDHILMARCQDIKRAEEVFEYYKNETDLNPVVIHQKTKSRSKILDEIKRGEHKIVVCVNMLGEGYDLPQLKIAALHDPRKSLPVMLQFIGRFTRSSHSMCLGEASFIINIADDLMNEALDELYRQDADWNEILPRLNDGIIEEEQKERNFLSDFSNIDFDINSINPAFSCLIYDVGDTWYPNAYKKYFTSDRWKYVYGYENHNGNTLIIIFGKETSPVWSNSEYVGEIEWNIAVVHRHDTTKYRHAYINVSGGGIDVNKLMEALFDNNVRLKDGETLFRVFHGMRRMGVTMFGGRKDKTIGKVSFKSFCGKDVEDGISAIEAGKLIRNNVTAYGYRNGKRTSVGCTVKGKIWSICRGNIFNYTEWCHEMSALIEDPTIDHEKVLSKALHFHTIDSLPDSMAIAADWNDNVWENPYRVLKLSSTGISVQVDWSDVSIDIVSETDCNNIIFALRLEETKAVYKYQISPTNKNGFEVTQIDGNPVFITQGNKEPIDVLTYFNSTDGIPVFYFANGDILQGRFLATMKDQAPLISHEQLIAIDWKGTKIQKESMHLLQTDDDKNSIQKFFLDNVISQEDYCVIYDDDGSGEIADLIGIKENPHSIELSLFHLKFASEGKVCNSIKNLYEVCGQAIRCLKWNNPDYAKKLFTHLLERAGNKSWNDKTGSRICTGAIDDLWRMSETVRYKKKLEFNIAIVQPAVSKKNASEEILRFLGCVSSYIDDVTNIKLYVYCSE